MCLPLGVILRRGATLADSCATLFHGVSVSSANATIALVGVLWLNTTVNITHSLTITSAEARATLRPSTTGLSFNISESVSHFELNNIDVAERSWLTISSELLRSPTYLSV